MAKRKKALPKLPHFWNENVEQHLCSLLYEQYDAAKRYQSQDDAEFESIVDLLECKRTEKDYEWMSDVFLPEYPAIHLTEASQWANQYFSTRDFVDVYLEGSDPMSKIKAQVAKKLLNATLNNRGIYHYQKYMRARSINSLRGCVYAVCNWERQNKKILVGYKEQMVEVGSSDMGQPLYERQMAPQFQEIPVLDRFNYEIIDPRNVFTDNKYCYSIQEKEWIIIRSEMTYDELKANEERNGYFNLDLVKQLVEEVDDDNTETKRETYGKDSGNKLAKSQITYFDVLEKFGKLWAVVTARDDDGFPVECQPGYDEFGYVLDEAELIEGIMTVAMPRGQKILILLQPTPFRDGMNRPYRPIVRGLCYVHPTKDVGMSSGKYSRELQVAINDTINMSNDRVKLATFPTLKGRKYSLEDNDQIYFEPEHVIPLENIDDLVEFELKDDIHGAMAQTQLFINSLHQVEAIYPTTMGDIPGRASTTATAIQGADVRTNMRSNYKALTFEYTFLIDFYWMILQMTYQFMHPMTAMKIMGPEAKYFDPNADYTYKPITSTIEAEYSKDRKIQRYDQIMGRLVALQGHPLLPAVVAHILQQQLMLLGEEYRDTTDLLSKFAKTMIPPEAPAGPNTGEGRPEPVSNQSGIPIGEVQAYARPGPGMRIAGGV